MCLQKKFYWFCAASCQSFCSYAVCRLSPVTCHLSPVTCHLSPVTCHLSPVTCHLSPVTCHLSPVTCHLSPVTCHLSSVTCHLSPVTCRLSPGRSPRDFPRAQAIFHRISRLESNERPGTGHVTSGPMRGQKKLHPMAHNHTTTKPQTDMAALWLNRPSGANSVKIGFSYTQRLHMMQITLHTPFEYNLNV